MKYLYALIVGIWIGLMFANAMVRMRDTNKHAEEPRTTVDISESERAFRQNARGLIYMYADKCQRLERQVRKLEEELLGYRVPVQQRNR